MYGDLTDTLVVYWYTVWIQGRAKERAGRTAAGAANL